MNKVDSVLALGTHDVCTHINLVHIIVALNHGVFLCVPELAHARVRNNRRGVAGELHLTLLELDLFFTSASFKFSFSVSVEIHGGSAHHKLEDSDSSIPPSSENVVIRLVVDNVDNSSAPARQNHHQQDEGEQHKLIVEPERTEEKSERAGKASR